MTLPIFSVWTIIEIDLLIFGLILFFMYILTKYYPGEEFEEEESEFDVDSKLDELKEWQK